ncbi:hypothetical protein B0H21DRAFT_26192 [Amylocystis lapponica]|nr:hypothetical protein B0H21DRAFT_26192 [Amylocystis lapponica]
MGDISNVVGLLAEYIQNTIPIRLIHIPTKKLMGRDTMMSLVWPDVEQMVKDDHKVPTLKGFDQRTAIEDIIEKRMAYAILSHRWLDFGEVTFQDMATYSQNPESMPTGPGMRKLMSFCDKAEQQYGCEWAWADTCCIDKRSSAELDESIRSMYRWYLYSKVCLVYLSDTLDRSDMASDVWFTRGWTLQELLASSNMKFFNKNWEPILPDQPNDKSDSAFLDDVSRITEIPSLDLYRFSSSTDRIREKMVWASKRKTTRVEDVAYSLIGLFDVSLVIAYGEGRRAFYRLQRAIMEKTGSMDLFIWEGYPCKDHSMIAWGLDCFSQMDRSDEFTNLLVPMSGRTRLQSEETARTLVPRGGKTFEMTNSGLRMDLVLYDVNVVELLPPDDGLTRYRLEIKHFPEIIIEPGLADSLSTGHDSPDRLKIGIVDYERDDASGKPDTFRSALLKNDMDYFWWQNAIERHQARTGEYTTPVDHDIHKLHAEAEKCIIAARANRWYTAILLQPGRLRRDTWRKVSTHSIIQVKRPKRGWAKPATVYVV